MTSEAPLLRLEVLPASCFSETHRDATHTSMLGGICFSSPVASVGNSDIPLMSVNMGQFDVDAPVCEVWHGSELPISGQHGAIRFRHDETLLFGCVSLDEIVSYDARSPLQLTAETAYLAIFALLESLGYHNVLRFWNYFPGINRESHDTERYRQFNVGRHEAFLAHGHAVIGNVPAACALGSSGPGLDIAFMATRASVINVENPRQISAYHYPVEYGPRSPTFSRAGLVRLGGQDMLFISGTASIVGHETLHGGDVEAQTRECLNNIAAIVAEANRLAPDATFEMDQLAYKVYVRHAENLQAVRRELTRFIGGHVLAVFLQADVCRADLLVEIEASGGHAIDFFTTGEAPG